MFYNISHSSVVFDSFLIQVVEVFLKLYVAFSKVLMGVLNLFESMDLDARDVWRANKLFNLYHFEMEVIADFI